MREQTRIISQDFMEFVEMHCDDEDFFLKIAKKELAVNIDKINTAVASTMEIIIRNCMVIKSLGLSYAEYLEGVIRELADIFEEAA